MVHGLWRSPGTLPVEKSTWSLENPGCLDSGQWMVHGLWTSPGTLPIEKSTGVDTGESWMLGNWSVDGAG